MTALDRRPLIAAVALGGAALVMGIRVVDALVLIMATLVVGVVSVSTGAGRAYRWPGSRLEESDGARSEIAALTWSFIGVDGQVTESAVRRLRSVATRRLARRGVVLTGGLGPQARDRPDDDQVDRARELLGERAWAALTSTGGRLPSLRDLAHCVDMIERLGPDRSTERQHL